MKKTFRGAAVVALSLLLGGAGALTAAGAAQAAAADDKIGKLPKHDYSGLQFLGSITMPTASGSLSDVEWLNDGPITTEASCPGDEMTWNSTTMIIHPDGAPNATPIAGTRYHHGFGDKDPVPGLGFDDNPISLAPIDGYVGEILYRMDFAGAIAPGPFWLVITCGEDNEPSGQLDSPYFAVKLQSDGTTWTAPGGGPVKEDKNTTTSFTQVASRTDGRVDFTATVAADATTVSGGTVDFVNAATSAVLATGTVVAGQARATSAAPVDPVSPVSVKAVYRGTKGFAASMSAAQDVTGVRPPNPGSGEGDVVVEVPERDNAPAGAVKFTAAASANLGKAELTAAGLSAAGSIDGATVTDTRRDKSAGWTVNGKASDFTIAGKAGTIPASALSWTPAVKAGTTLPAGATAGPANQKLDGERELVRWAAGGSSVGDAKSEVGASLKLEAQGNIAPGTYSAKLTLTLI